MFEDCSLDNVDTGKGRIEKARFEEKRKYRIGFPWLKDGSVNVRPVQYYKYNESLRRGFIVPVNVELQKKCEKVMGSPQTRYVTPIIVYRTNSQGEILKGEFEYEILPFVMDSKKVAKLKEIHQIHPLTENDLKVTCQGEKYQDLEFINVPPCYWKELAKKNPEFAKKLKEELEDCVNRMQGAVSIPATEDQIKRWLGLEDEANKGASLEDITFGSKANTEPLDVSDLFTA